MKSWTIHCLNSRSALTPNMERVKEAISNVHSRTFGSVPEIPLDIVVEAVVNGGIPETGYCGYSPRPGVIFLSIDPSNENLKSHLGVSLERVIAHELHHALRWDSIGYGSTLVEAIVSEGLAGRFSQELYGNEPELWEAALSSLEISKYLKQAIQESDADNYDHHRWFFGDGDIPRWAGYTLGWELVGNLSGDLTGLKPSEMIATPAIEFTDSLATLALKYEQSIKN
ncbi:MAG: DUF2268 domain-containing putative Zn-dependent protease [Sedimenticola sp.]